MDYISKAYQALTDPVSRENFEKYGHPDGRQVIECYYHGEENVKWFQVYLKFEFLE